MNSIKYLGSIFLFLSYLSATKSSGPKMLPKTPHTPYTYPNARTRVPSSQKITTYAKPPQYTPMYKTIPKDNRIPKKPADKPHFVIYHLGDNTNGVNEDYKDHPAAGNATDFSLRHVDKPTYFYDADFYHRHSPPLPFTYEGSVVPHTAYGF